MDKIKELTDRLDMTRIPRHVAIIMDGNGRWARERMRGRSEGHAEGVNSVHNITRHASDLGIKHLTLYAFSTENWNRPPQ
ncbi:MAG: undecaprenyl diphosphate synthase family protein, partial [Muribaculaceae bacterium]|nr:undecaprenyl diphosphate synthase family protein [Muribaculaceae bacterium]